MPPDNLDKDIRRLIKKLRKISRVEVQRANAKALNNVAKLSRTRIVRGVAKQTRIKSKDIRRKTFFSKATAKRQKAVLTGYSRPVSAISVLTKKQRALRGKGTNKQGVKARGYEWPGAFVAKGLSGNVHVFDRTGEKHRPRKGNYPGQRRDKITSVKIDVQKPFERGMKVVPRRVMKKDFKRLLEHELNIRIKKFQV
jgi:hypothetical protein